LGGLGGGGGGVGGVGGGAGGGGVVGGGLWVVGGRRGFGWGDGTETYGEYVWRGCRLLNGWRKPAMLGAAGTYR